MAFLGSASTATGRPELLGDQLRDQRDPRRAADQQHRGELRRGPARPSSPPARSAVHGLLDLRRGSAARTRCGAAAPSRARRAAAPGSTPRCRCSAPPWPRCSRGGSGPPRTAPPGRCRRGSSNASGMPGRTCSNTTSSKSMPPSRSSPSGRPSSPKPAGPDRPTRRRPCARRRRRRCRRPGRTPRSWSRRRPARRRRSAAPRPAARPGTSTVRPCPASARASRSFLCAPQDAGWVTAIRSGRAALALGHPVDHPAHQPGRELLGRPVPAGHHDRRRVADAALELAHHPVRVGQRPPLGGLADQHRRRPAARNSTDGDGGAAAAERDHLGLHPAAGPTSGTPRPRCTSCPGRSRAGSPCVGPLPGPIVGPVPVARRAAPIVPGSLGSIRAGPSDARSARPIRTADRGTVPRPPLMGDRPGRSRRRTPGTASRAIP